MATYTYRCSKHGEFDLEYPMGEAAEYVICFRVDMKQTAIACSSPAPCGRRSPRVFNPAGIVWGPGFRAPYMKSGTPQGGEEAKRFR